jgi:hypothetical protein
MDSFLAKSDSESDTLFIVLNCNELAGISDFGEKSDQVARTTRWQTALRALRMHARTDKKNSPADWRGWHRYWLSQSVVGRSHSPYSFTLARFQRRLLAWHCERCAA